MNSPHLAVILLSPPDSGYSLILENKVAGVPVFKRLILTLQRAGIKEFLVLSNQLDEREIKIHRKNIEKDSRFKSLLHWHDRTEFFAESNKEQANALTPSQQFLLVNGNLVTHQKVVQRFMESEDNNNPAGIFCLALEKPGGLYLLPPTKFSTLSHRNGTEDNEDKVERITLPTDTNFFIEVRNNASALEAEEKLLRYNKHHYHQFMDIWVNSLFSRHISAVLVKTPLTPNVLSLFGLFIGFLSGWCFAQGNYLSGLAGSLLLVLTAIWDCCDGDVARLKLIESDFGEKLDTICDNLVNVFAFTGMMLGISQTHGWAQAIIPFTMLAVGGGAIFAFIYFPKGGKGSFFRHSEMYDVIQTLASRNFIYVILLFAIGGHLNWFLWLAGVGSLTFAMALFLARRQTIKTALSDP